MNLDKIFALFDYKNEDKPLSEEDNNIIALYEKPLFWVGMFERLIQNNNIFKHQLEKVLSGSKDFNHELLSDTSNAIVYNRAYAFLELIDINNEDHQMAVRARAKHSYLINNLIMVLNYFISTEEYEKCTVLKKILDFAQESLEA